MGRGHVTILPGSVAVDLTDVYSEGRCRHYSLQMKNTETTKGSGVGPSQGEGWVKAERCGGYS